MSPAPGCAFPAVFGGSFKFDDHFSAVNDRRQPFGISGTEALLDLTRQTRLPEAGIEAARDRLDQVFREFAGRYVGETGKV